MLLVSAVPSSPSGEPPNQKPWLGLPHSRIAVRVSARLSLIFNRRKRDRVPTVHSSPTREPRTPSGRSSLRTHVVPHTPGRRGLRARAAQPGLCRPTSRHRDGIRCAGSLLPSAPPCGGRRLRSDLRRRGPESTDSAAEAARPGPPRPVPASSNQPPPATGDTRPVTLIISGLAQCPSVLPTDLPVPPSRGAAGHLALLEPKRKNSGD